MRKSGAAVLFLVAVLWAPSAARAQGAVIVVRHGEKISETDQRLSEAGRARAARLAALLKDTGIVAIYSTDTERAKDTVQPLADATKLPVRIYDLPASGAGKPIVAQPFVTGLRNAHPHGVLLVVGHSNTVPAILQALGVPGMLKLAADEYDNLFVVVPTGRGATLVRLRY